MITKTERTCVEGTVGIWAVPKTDWEMDTEREEGVSNPLPFKFQLSTGTVYTTGAIKLHEVEVSAWLPDGIDLLQAALKTLKEEMEHERASHDMKMADLQRRMDSLLLLTHDPEEDVIDV